VGVPPAGEETCAVKVTACPATDGLLLEVTEVDVPAWTCWIRDSELFA
jgi:hypothetical protein